MLGVGQEQQVTGQGPGPLLSATLGLGQLAESVRVMLPHALCFALAEMSAGWPLTNMLLLGCFGAWPSRSRAYLASPIMANQLPFNARGSPSGL